MGTRKCGGLGFVIGLAVGAAAAYFADRKNREQFGEQVRTQSQKAREVYDQAHDSLVENYYDAKDKYVAYRDRLMKKKDEMNEISEELEEDLCEGVDEKF